MTTRLKICIVAPGSNVHTRRWVEALAGRGHDVLLVPLDGRDPGVPIPMFDPYRHMGPIRQLPRVRGLLAVRLIVRRLREWAPDVIHMHWLNVSSGMLHLTRRIGPFVLSVWGRDIIWDGPAPESRRRMRLKRRILERAARVTATSRFLADRTRPFLSDGRAVQVIPFGVDCSRFTPPATRARHARPVIGFLKHFAPKYGPDVLLEAAALLERTGVDFEVRMHGTRDAAPYQRRAESLGISHKVTFGGTVPHEEVPALLRTFDIYVMPSIHDSESFGVAALEASACGVPVLASRVGGVPEVVEDGLTGLLVPPADPAALAEGLRRLLGDPSLRDRMGTAGAAFVRRQYRWESCVERMEAVYADLRRGGVS